MLHGLSAIPAILAALVLRTDRRLVAELEAAGALTPATAAALAPRRALVRWRLARLSRAGAIGHSAAGGVYLDASGWAAYRRRRRRRVLLTLVVVVPLIIASAWALSGP
jgi:hypothetical protein